MRALLMIWLDWIKRGRLPLIPCTAYLQHDGVRLAVPLHLLSYPLHLLLLLHIAYGQDLRLFFGMFILRMFGGEVMQVRWLIHDAVTNSTKRDLRQVEVFWGVCDTYPALTEADLFSLLLLHLLFTFDCLEWRLAEWLRCAALLS